MNTFRSSGAHPQKQAGHSVRVSSRSTKADSLASIRGIALGSGCTLAFGLLFLLLATGIVYRSSDMNSLLLPLSHTALYLTALFAGIVTVRLANVPPLLCGLISSAFLLLCCLLFAIFLPSTKSDAGLLPLLLRIPIPLFAVSGAYLARKRPRTRNRHHHRRS